jgi:hypothetical protein
MRGVLQADDWRGPAVSAGRCADFQIEREAQRFWSPHLSIQLHDTAEGCQLVGRFSPRPEILTLIWAIYFVAAITIFAALIYAYVQWFLKEPPWAMAIVPIAVGVIALLHVASVIGQRLSADQMQLLRGRLDRTLRPLLDEAVDEPPAELSPTPC